MTDTPSLEHQQQAHPIKTHLATTTSHNPDLSPSRHLLRQSEEIRNKLDYIEQRLLNQGTGLEGYGYIEDEYTLEDPVNNNKVKVNSQHHRSKRKGVSGGSGI